MTDSQRSMEGKPEGWYSDPTGHAVHLAYWDGRKWTGETANPDQLSEMSQVRKKNRWTRWYMWILYAFVILILSVCVFVTNLATYPLGDAETCAEMDAAVTQIGIENLTRFDLSLIVVNIEDLDEDALRSGDEEAYQDCTDLLDRLNAADE